MVQIWRRSSAKRSWKHLALLESIAADPRQGAVRTGEFAVYRSRRTAKWRDEFVAHPAGPLPVRRQLVARGHPRAERPAPPPRRREPAPDGDRVSSNGSQPELVTITVDDVEIQVPKGIGLVEAALYAGIEIPVFCYEPRRGPPVGACRMCLCEGAPGPPKPGRMHRRGPDDGREDGGDLRDGRRGRTRRSSSSSSTTRSIAVCDKGGECPLQDDVPLRAGNTRMRFPSAR
jgi:hypothetical protein